jgi:hypothetical protein
MVCYYSPSFVCVPIVKPGLYGLMRRILLFRQHRQLELVQDCADWSVSDFMARNVLAHIAVYSGLVSGNLPTGVWGTGLVMQSLSYNATIPANLAPGEYMIRVRCVISCSGLRH